MPVTVITGGSRGIGRAAVELILDIYKSARTGRPVSLPLGDFSAKEMEGFRP